MDSCQNPKASGKQSFCKGQKALNIAEIGDHPHRNTDCATGFAINAQAEIVNAQAVFVVGPIAPATKRGRERSCFCQSSAAARASLAASRFSS